MPTRKKNGKKKVPNHLAGPWPAAAAGQVRGASCEKQTPERALGRQHLASRQHILSARKKERRMKRGGGGGGNQEVGGTRLAGKTSQNLGKLERERLGKNQWGTHCNCLQWVLKRRRAEKPASRLQ